MNQEVILIGGFHEIIELCEDLNITIIGIFANTNEEQYMGYPIIGSDTDATILYPKYKNIPLVITPDKPLIRKNLFDYYSLLGYNFLTLISKNARISKSATIGNGAIIQDGVNISSKSKIGNLVKINTNANVMHDITIGDYTTIAPNAVILGGVIIEDFCYIGANATILPKIIIKQNSIVGAGSVVTHNVKQGVTVKGVPARE